MQQENDYTCVSTKLLLVNSFNTLFGI